MNELQVIEVKLHQQTVGRLAMTPDYVCAFEYDADYLQNGVSISPFYLPLKTGVFQAKRRPFDGNFGVFSDSLPDGWGSLLLDRFLRSHGIQPENLSILQRLSLAGTTGRGALEYLPTNALAEKHVNHLSLQQLALESERILNTEVLNETSKLDELFRVAGSSGGARPKAFVQMDGAEWLIKFKASNDPDDVGIEEYNYSLLAKKCGIEMPETKLFEGSYFGTRRFDRTANQKYHVISAAGLLNADYRIPSLDYEVLLTACYKLTRNMEEVHKLFRLMVFNILIKNKDDHAKNFSFILSGNTWSLSPAYDLLPSTGFNNQHTTTVNGQGNPSMKDILTVGSNVGLQKSRMDDIIEQIQMNLSALHTL